MSMQDNFVENLRADAHPVVINRLLKHDFAPSLELCERIARGLEVEPPARILQKNCFGLERPLAKRKSAG
jgi:hypothetical protein